VPRLGRLHAQSKSVSGEPASTAPSQKKFCKCRSARTAGLPACSMTASCAPLNWILSPRSQRMRRRDQPSPSAWSHISKSCPRTFARTMHLTHLRVESTRAYVYTVRLLALVFSQGERANSCRPILSPHLFNPTAIRGRRSRGGSRTAPTRAIGHRSQEAGERR
jgi:hypothetical protein